MRLLPVGPAPKFSVVSYKILGPFALWVPCRKRRYFFCQVTLSSSNDDNSHQMNQCFFPLQVHGPRPARLPPLVR